METTTETETPKRPAGPDQAMCFMAALCYESGNQNLGDMCLMELYAYLAFHDAMDIKRRPALA